MGLGCSESDVSINDGDGGFGGGCEKPIGSVSCSICLDVVSDNGDRSLAKLQCGHQFHLDCIGSAFNIKGAMQCPNCRKVEKGQWLYANGCRSLPEFTVDDWAHDEDIYDLSYSEMSIGVHWCPFGSLAHLPSLFDEGEFSPNTYHDILGQHTIFAEHTTTVSSAAHTCPYFAYFGPIPPSSSNSSGNGLEGLSLNNYWNASPVPGELPNHYAFPAVDLHYHAWEHRSPPFSTSGSRIASGDQPSFPPPMQQPVRNSSDLPRSGSFLRPFLVGHRAGSIVGSSMIPPYQDSNGRARYRVQPYHQQQPGNPPAIRTPIISGTRRSSGHRGSSQAGTVASSSDQTGFFFIPPGTSGRSLQEAENPLPIRFHGWDRDHALSFSSSQVDRQSSWSFHHVASGSDPAIRSSSFR